MISLGKMPWRSFLFKIDLGKANQSELKTPWREESKRNDL
jgi:hypothetical protein